MKVGQTTAVFFVSKIVGSALGFLATVYFAQILGAEVLGYYYLVLALAGWLGIGGELGLTNAVTKRLSEGEDRAAYLVAGAISMAAFGGVVAAGVLVFAPYVDAYVGTTAAPFVAALLLATLFSSLVNAALQGQHLVHLSGILSAVKIGVRSLVQVGLVVAGFGLVGMVAGHAIGVTLIGLVGVAFLGVRVVRPTIEHFRRLFDFAKYAWLGSVRGRAYSEMDILVLGVFVSSAVVGVYSVAWSLAAFLALFGKSVTKAMFPEISKGSARQDRQAVRSLAREGIGYAGLVTLPGLVGGALLADRLLLIYGPEFVGGATVLSILIAAVLVNGYQSQYLNVLNAIDRPELSFRVNGAFLVSNVGLNVVLIWAYGSLGAAIATFLSACLGLGLAHWFAASEIEIPVPSGRIGRQAVSAAVMGVVVYLGREGFDAAAVTQNTAVVVLTLVGLGGLTYFGTLYAISVDFRNSVSRNLEVVVE